jgi:hypothetical protein
MPVEYWLVADWNSHAMPNTQIQGEAINSETLFKIIAISIDKTEVVGHSCYWIHGMEDVKHKVMSCQYLCFILWVWKWPIRGCIIQKTLMHEQENEREIVALSMKRTCCIRRQGIIQQCCHDRKPKASLTLVIENTKLISSPTMWRTKLQQQSTVRCYQQRTP